MYSIIRLAVVVVLDRVTAEPGEMGGRPCIRGNAAYEAARRAERRLGREVNVTIRSEQQSAGDGFTLQLKSSPLLEIACHIEADRDGGRR